MAFCLTLRKNSTIPYFSTGHVQLHHIIDSILEEIGGADVFISSFTIAEEFIRKLNRLKENKLINTLELLIDLRSAKKTLHLSYFLSQVCDDVFLGNNHSKIMLLSNNNWRVSVVTSQNQTRGNRYEAGMISTEKHVFDFYRTEISRELEKCISINGIFQ